MNNERVDIGGSRSPFSTPICGKYVGVTWDVTEYPSSRNRSKRGSIAVLGGTRLHQSYSRGSEKEHLTIPFTRPLSHIFNTSPIASRIREKYTEVLPEKDAIDPLSSSTDNLSVCSSIPYRKNQPTILHILGEKITTSDVVGSTQPCDVLEPAGMFLSPCLF